MKRLVYLPDSDIELMITKSSISALIVPHIITSSDGRIKKIKSGASLKDSDIALYMSSETYCIDNPNSVIKANDYFMPIYLKSLLRKRLANNEKEHIIPYFDIENTLCNNIISYEIVETGD